MRYKYGDKRTALNGVFKHVFGAYPKATEKLGFFDKIPKDQQHCRWNPTGFNKFLQDYRLSRNSNPSKNPDKNAQYIQKDFFSFMEYCKTHLK